MEWKHPIEPRTRDEFQIGNEIKYFGNWLTADGKKAFIRNAITNEKVQIYVGGFLEVGTEYVFTLWYAGDGNHIQTPAYNLRICLEGFPDLARDNFTVLAVAG
ncbi:MAG: hypothetical protein ACREHG_03325 [Candidatus Saccharimonadales bacterium]